MKIAVHIRRNSNGVVRTHVSEWDDLHGFEWQWTEGNYGCDCNRELFFDRASGDEDSSDDCQCGETAYTVLKCEQVDGPQIPFTDNRIAA